MYLKVIPGICLPHFWENGRKVVGEIMGLSPTRGIKD